MFFSGSSYYGSYPVAHESNKANCVLTKFSLINNTNSIGCFSLGYRNHKRVRDSVVMFKSTGTLKWIYRYTEGATLLFEGFLVIAKGTFQTDTKTTLTNETKITPSASTHAPFHSHMDYKGCWYFSRDFSNSLWSYLSLSPLLDFALMSIAFVLSLPTEPLVDLKAAET